MNNTALNIINIIALLVIPIASVLVAQWLQDSAAKRKDKMAIFQYLMTHRATGWANPDAVNALNTIDIVFANNDAVRSCWASLHSKYKPNFSAQEVNTAQCKLLEEMAKALRYGNKITWETIQNPYYPEGLMQRTENATLFEKGQLAFAEYVVKMAGNPSILGDAMLQQAAKQENKNNADA